MGRAPCCDKANVKKGPWSLEEDATLKAYIEKNGIGGNWIALPQKIGLKRCGKSCRLRWLNYLRPNIKHGGFTEEEDDIICNLYINIGSRWSIIASQLPGRTDNDIKNYWNTKLKKKLLGKQPKEHAKRAHLLKQEVKSEAHQDLMFPGVVNQVSYWAGMMPTSMTMMNNTSQDFSHQPQETMQYSMDAFPSQDQIYANSLNMVTSPSTTASINPMFDTFVSQLLADMFLEPESVPFELTEEALYGNLDQTDGFNYGVDVMSGSTGTSSVASAESGSWGGDHMNSLVYDYPSMVPDFEANKEGGHVPQDSTYQEEFKYFGPQ